MNKQPLTVDEFIDSVFTEDEPDGELYDPDPIKWIETHFYIPETNAAIQLVDYQKAVIREALRKQDGKFIYSLVLYSDIKKSAKSTIAAAVTLYLAWHTAWESVRIVANDLKQADSRTFFYIERAIELNPLLRERITDRRKYHIKLPNHTTIDAIPVDPGGEAGGGDLIICFTELWAAKNDKAKQLWTETTLSPLKFGLSLRWCESYAGFEGESPILEQLYEAGVKNGRQIDNEIGIPGLELYVNESGRMLTLWNTVPRCDWQTAEYYAQESAVLTPSEMSRIHGNQWGQSESVFVPIEAWDKCKAVIPILQPKTLLVLAVDAAVSGDCGVIVGVGRQGEITQVRYTRIWTPPKGGQIDLEEMKDDIARLDKEYYVIEVVYDPYQLESIMQRLRKDGVNCQAFNQGVERLIADKILHDDILARRVEHDGNEDIRAHIRNANKKEDGSDNKLRIVKKNEAAKIDFAVALSMGNRRAKALNMG